MSVVQCLEIIDKGDYAVVEFDLKGEKVNKLSSPVMRRLGEVTAELAKSNYKAVVVKSKKIKYLLLALILKRLKVSLTRQHLEKFLRKPTLFLMPGKTYLCQLLQLLTGLASAEVVNLS